MDREASKGSVLSRWFVRHGRLRSGWRVGLYLACYSVGLLIVQIPLGVLLAILLILQGARDTSALLHALQPGHIPIWFYAAVKAGELGMLLPLTILFRRLLDRGDLASLGFRRERGWLLDMLLGWVLGGMQMLLIFLIEWGGGWLAVEMPDGATLAKGMREGLLAMGLFVTVAVGEELMFRGYLQTNLQEGLGLIPAWVLTSLLFGLFHIMNPNLTWMAVFNIALVGLSIGYGWMVVGNLWLPMAYHFGWNFFQGPVFSLPVSGVRYGGLLRVTDRGLSPFITGAAFGPEGGLVGTLVLLSSFPVFWLWGRWRRATQTRDKS